MTEQAVALRLAIMSLALSVAGVAGAAEMLKDAAAAPTTYPTTSPAVSDSVRPWSSGVRIRPVLPSDAQCHSIHSYFNLSPESPDGRFVLYFKSKASDGQLGDICVLERTTGTERALVTGVHTEDAHRVAAQQWVSGGKRVAFQDERDGKWLTAVVDVETGKQRVLAEDRLCCWGTPGGDEVPLYGPHWNPGEHHDLELVNVATGEIRTVVTNEAMRAAYPEYISKQFKDKPTSIFFPILSPDGSRIFFKIASSSSGAVRTKDASIRDGLVVYDLKTQKFLGLYERWGHPSWYRDSRTIVEHGNVLIDTSTRQTRKIPNLPAFPGAGHPSASHDGKLLVEDAFNMTRFGGTNSQRGVFVADLAGGSYALIQLMPDGGGAYSWRVSHPHPVFTADDRRIYYNVNDGKWTRLFVAEIDPAAASTASN